MMFTAASQASSSLFFLLITCLLITIGHGSEPGGGGVTTLRILSGKVCSQSRYIWQVTIPRHTAVASVIGQPTREGDDFNFTLARGYIPTPTQYDYLSDPKTRRVALNFPEAGTWYAAVYGDERSSYETDGSICKVVNLYVTQTACDIYSAGASCNQPVADVPLAWSRPADTLNNLYTKTFYGEATAMTTRGYTTRAHQSVSRPVVTDSLALDSRHPDPAMIESEHRQIRVLQQELAVLSTPTQSYHYYWQFSLSNDISHLRVRFTKKAPGTKVTLYLRRDGIVSTTVYDKAGQTISISNPLGGNYMVMASANTQDTIACQVSAVSCPDGSTGRNCSLNIRPTIPQIPGTPAGATWSSDTYTLEPAYNQYNVFHIQNQNLGAAEMKLYFVVKYLEPGNVISFYTRLNALPEVVEGEPSPANDYEGNFTFTKAGRYYQPITPKEGSLYVMVSLSGASNQRAHYGVVLDAQLCPDNGCNSESIGNSCDWLDGSPVPTAQCICSRFYAGYNCERRSERGGLFILHTLFLTLSSCVIAPAIWYAWKFRHLPELIMFSGVFITSPMYHICDQGIFCFWLPYEAWHYADFFFAIGSAAFTIVTIADYPPVVKSMFQTIIFLVMVPLLRADATSILYLGITIAIATFTLVLRITYRRRLPHLRWAFFFLGIIPLVGAIVAYVLANDKTYWILHSTFHVCITGACFFAIMATSHRPVPDVFQWYEPVGTSLPMPLYKILKRWFPRALSEPLNHSDGIDHFH